MNKQRVIELLRTPKKTSVADYRAMAKLVHDNPFFQAGRIVLAQSGRYLKSKNSKKTISTAAIYTTNLAVFKSYMNGKVDFANSAAPVVTKRTSAVTRKKAIEAQQDVVHDPLPIHDDTHSASQDAIIKELYENLEKWKTSRAEYLEYESHHQEEIVIESPEPSSAAAINFDDLKSKVAKEVEDEEKAVENSIKNSIATKTITTEAKPAEEIQPIVHTEPSLDESNEESASTVNLSNNIDLIENSKRPVENTSVVSNKDAVQKSTPSNPAQEENNKTTDAPKSSVSKGYQSLADLVKQQKNNVSSKAVPVVSESSDEIKVEASQDEVVVVEARAENAIVETSQVEGKQEKEDTLDEALEVSDESKQESEPAVPKRVNASASLNNGERKKFRLSIMKNSAMLDKLNKKKTLKTNSSSISTSDQESSPSDNSIETTEIKEAPDPQKSAEKPVVTRLDFVPSDSNLSANAESKEWSKPNNKVDHQDLIDSFISLNPSIKIMKKDDLDERLEDLTIESETFPEELATENLAKILVSQGNTHKAILVYEQLCLKIPEKKAYFASQIEKLKKK